MPKEIGDVPMNCLCWSAATACWNCRSRCCWAATANDCCCCCCIIPASNSTVSNCAVGDVSKCAEHGHWTAVETADHCCYRHSHHNISVTHTNLTAFCPGLPERTGTRNWATDSERLWHRLGHMQVCTSLKTDNHTSTPPLSFFTGQMHLLAPNQQLQSTLKALSQHIGKYLENCLRLRIEVRRIVLPRPHMVDSADAVNVYTRGHDHIVHCHHDDHNCVCNWQGPLCHYSRSCYKNNNNKQICIAPSGRNFTGAGARQHVSEQRKKKKPWKWGMSLA